MIAHFGGGTGNGRAGILFGERKRSKILFAPKWAVGAAGAVHGLAGLHGAGWGIAFPIGNEDPRDERTGTGKDENTHHTQSCRRVFVHCICSAGCGNGSG